MAAARPSAASARLATAVALALGLALAAGRAGAAPRSAAVDSIRFMTATTDANQVGLCLTNYGFFGTSFVNRSPSFEYPLGSGYDHMTRGGLWVGALAIGDTGEFIGVSTGVVDNSQGSNATDETEFTPAGRDFIKRSRIRNNEFYSPLALSDEDLICSYSDMPALDPRGYQSEPHRPLQIVVNQRTLVFSLKAASSFVIPQITIANHGPPLRNVYVGIYAQFVSGDKNAYGTWPPSGASPAGSWYYKTHAEYDAPRRLYKEHYCLGIPYPAACNFGYCPPWASVKLLKTWPEPVDTKTVSFNWWKYSPGDTLRDTDLERYGVLSNGQVMDLSSCVPGTDCSPIMVLSVGPFAQLLPGDSLRVDLAFVGGADEDDLLKNADFAQFASDIDYQLPEPPPSPGLHVAAGERRVDLYWDDFPEHVEDPTSPAPGHLDFEGYRVYLGLDRQNPTLVAQFDRADPPHDTTGFNTGLDAIRLDPPVTIGGHTYRYKYTVGALKDGFSYFGGVTSYDLGDDKIESLESGLSQNKFQVVPAPAPGERPHAGVTVFPNPYRVEARWDQGQKVRDHYLWFANLPPRCHLRIYTLSGDLVFEKNFDGAAEHGTDARGVFNPKTDLDVDAPTLSGASYPWDMITTSGQAVATGLYLFAVEDLATGRTERGKFLVVKSDREE